VVSVEGNVLELPGGCLCCAVREDLRRPLRGLIERRDDGEIRRFRRIVIETSGLADPARCCSPSAPTRCSISACGSAAW